MQGQCLGAAQEAGKVVTGTLLLLTPAFYNVEESLWHPGLIVISIDLWWSTQPQVTYIGIYIHMTCLGYHTHLYVLSGKGEVRLKCVETCALLSWA